MAQTIVCKALALPSTRKSALKMIDRNACLIPGVINWLLISIINAAKSLNLQSVWIYLLYETAYCNSNIMVDIKVYFCPLLVNFDLKNQDFSKIDDIFSNHQIVSVLKTKFRVMC